MAFGWIRIPTYGNALFILLATLIAVPAGAQNADQPDVRTLVHILDYVAKDYPAAVQGGKVISNAEYDEMHQFGETAATLVDQLTREDVLDGEDATDGVAVLQERIAAFADPSDVSASATQLRNLIIEDTGLRIAPPRWPDIEAGAIYFADNCAMCHGTSGRGDGEKAPGLDPPPANFVDGTRPAALAPYQAFNTIRLGVEGTSMASFDSLSSDMVWNLAFFVKSLQSRERVPDANRRSSALANAEGVVSLGDAATMSDTDLLTLLQRASVPDPEVTLAAVRTAGPDDLGGTSLAHARILVNEAVKQYRNGDRDMAIRSAVSAYLQGVEPVEPSLRAQDPELVRQLERDMLTFRGAISSGESVERTRELASSIQTSILRAEDLMAASNHTAWFAFIMATSILLREGLEAFLIIMAILGVLYASGKKHAVRWVHAGWIMAVLVGLGGWFLVDLLLSFGAAQREILEGGIALVAVVVLLYVGFWLHSKTSARKWKEFIDERIHSQLSTGSLWGLTGIAFFAVFREAFESVLFLSALTLEEGGGGTKTALAGAAVVTFSFILILGVVFIRTSRKMPLKQLFRYASFAMAFLAVVLVGKGIHALQEAGTLPVKSLPFTFRIDLMGIFPTVETLTGQVLVLGAVLMLWLLPAILRRRTAVASLR